MGEVSPVKPKVEAVKTIHCWKRKNRVVSHSKPPCPLVHEAEPTPNTADCTSPSSRQWGASADETSSDVCRDGADGISLSGGLGFLLEVVSIITNLMEAVFVLSTYRVLVARERAKGGSVVVLRRETTRLQSHYYSSV